MLGRGQNYRPVADRTIFYGLRIRRRFWTASELPRLVRVRVRVRVRARVRARVRDVRERVSVRVRARSSCVPQPKGSPTRCAKGRIRGVEPKP